MKNYIFLKIMILGCLLISMTACSSGEESNPGIPTPSGTAINITSLKAISTGAAAAGTTLGFSLVGLDSENKPWIGTVSYISDGTTAFESQEVTKSRVHISLTKQDYTAGGLINSNTYTITRYFLFTDGSFYKAEEDAVPTSLQISLRNISDVIHVGDSGDLGTELHSNGNTVSGTWRLLAGYNGKSRLIISSTINYASSEANSTEDDTFHLDASGNPYAYDMKITKNGLIINLSGD